MIQESITSPAASPAALRFSFHPRDLALVLLITIGAVLPFWRLTSPDFFWHVKTGELIVEELRPPRADVFSFTSEGKAWPDHEWLAQVLMYGADSAWGYAGSVFAFALIGLASVLAGHYLMKRLGVPDLLALALTALAIVLGFQFWIVRPAPISAAMLGAVYCNLYLYQSGRADRLWVLPAVMAVWANSHGGYVVGLGLMALLAADLLARGGFRDRRFRHAAIVCAASFVATGINPYTYELWLYPFTYFTGENHSISIISEWQSPDFFHSIMTLPLGLTILALVALGASPGRVSLWRTGIAVLFTFFALQSERHQLFFAVVIPPLLGDIVAARWPSLLRLERRPLPAGLTLANMAVAAVFAALAVQMVATRGIQTGAEPRLDAAALPFPVEGAAYLVRELPEARVFNEYAWGGYLIYENWPAQKVFIDGRADLHGDLLAEYELVWSGRAGWGEVLDKYSIDAVLFGKHSELAGLLRASPAWVEVFSGPVEAIFLRR